MSKVQGCGVYRDIALSCQFSLDSRLQYTNLDRKFGASTKAMAKVKNIKEKRISTQSRVVKGAKKSKFMDERVGSFISPMIWSPVVI